MAAVVHAPSHGYAHPIPDRRVGPGHHRPDLRVLPGGRLRRRPSRAVLLRRRLIAALVLASVLWLAGWVLGSLGGSPLAASEPARPVTGHTYVVQPGDTLWSVATRLGRGGDIRRTVQELADANGGSAIVVGQQLVVP
jgi:hypothetical protein